MLILILISLLTTMFTKTKISYSIVGYHEPADGLGSIHIGFYEALDQLGKAYFNSTSLEICHT